MTENGLPPTALAAYNTDDGDTIYTTGPIELPALITVNDILAVVDELAIASAVTPRSRILRLALITQLREAIVPSIGGTGSGRGSGRGVLLNVGAWECWEDITTRIEAMHEDLEGEAPVAGSHEQILLAWSRDLVAADQTTPHGLNQDTLQFALHRVTRIRDLIVNVFDPPRTGDIPGAVCIECGATQGVILVDGEEIPAPAIYWTHSKRDGLAAHCRVCDQTWPGDFLDAMDRMKWAQRRNIRINDLSTEITTDDWHHIRRDLRDAATQTPSRLLWGYTPKETR